MQILDRMDHALSRSIDWTMAHAKSVSFFTFVFVITSIFLTSRLDRIVSFENHLDPNLESTYDFLHAKDLMGQKSGLGFILRHPTQGDLCKIKHLIPELAQDYPEIEDSVSALSLRQARRENNQLHYPELYPDPCQQKPEAFFDTNLIKNSPWQNILTSKLGEDLFTAISVSYQADRTGQLMRQIQTSFKQEVLWTGTVAHDYYTNLGLDQSIWQNIVVFLVVLFAFRIAFGTFKSCFIFFGTLCVSTFGVYGGMKCFGHQLDPLNVCLFLMLTVAALEDFVFLSYAQMENNLQANPQSSFHELALPCLFTSLTTLIAFGSLALSHLVSIRHFGLWAAYGSVLEWISVFLLLPAFATLFPKAAKWTRSDRAFFRNISTRWIQKIPSRRLVWLSFIFFFSAFYSIHHASISQTPTEMFTANHPFQKGIDYVRKTRGWTADAELYFEANVLSARKQEIIRDLGKIPIIQQIERWDKIEEFVSRPVQNPLTRELIHREIKVSSLYAKFFAASGEEAVNLYLTTTNTHQINELRRTVKTWCPQKECWLTGEFITFADYSDHLLSTLFDSLSLSLILVALVILFLCYAKNEMPQFLKLIVTSFWGPAVLITCFCVFNISIDFITCIVASTLIGLTGDNAVQFLLGKREGALVSGIHARGQSAIQCSVIMALCSLSFIFSYFGPARTLGLLLASGFIFALIGDLWLLQGLLHPQKTKPVL